MARRRQIQLELPEESVQRYVRDREDLKRMPDHWQFRIVRAKEGVRRVYCGPYTDEGFTVEIIYVLDGTGLANWQVLQRLTGLQVRQPIPVVVFDELQPADYFRCMME